MKESHKLSLIWKGVNLFINPLADSWFLRSYSGPILTSLLYGYVIYVLMVHWSIEEVIALRISFVSIFTVNILYLGLFQSKLVARLGLYVRAYSWIEKCETSACGWVNAILFALCMYLLFSVWSLSHFLNDWEWMIPSLVTVIAWTVLARLIINSVSLLRSWTLPNLRRSGLYLVLSFLAVVYTLLYTQRDPNSFMSILALGLVIGLIMGNFVLVLYLRNHGLRASQIDFRVDALENSRTRQGSRKSNVHQSASSICSKASGKRIQSLISTGHVVRPWLIFLFDRKLKLDLVERSIAHCRLLLRTKRFRRIHEIVNRAGGIEHSDRLASLKALAYRRCFKPKEGLATIREVNGWESNVRLLINAAIMCHEFGDDLEAKRLTDKAVSANENCDIALNNKACFDAEVANNEFIKGRITKDEFIRQLNACLIISKKLIERNLQIKELDKRKPQIKSKSLAKFWDTYAYLMLLSLEEDRIETSVNIFSAAILASLGARYHLAIFSMVGTFRYANSELLLRSVIHHSQAEGNARLRDLAKVNLQKIEHLRSNNFRLTLDSILHHTRKFSELPDSLLMKDKSATLPLIVLEKIEETKSRVLMPLPRISAWPAVFILFQLSSQLLQLSTTTLKGSERSEMGAQYNEH